MEKKTKDKVINLGLIALIGGLAGIFGCQLFLPWLAGFSIFQKIDWINRAKEGVTIINRTEKIVITENDALEQAIGRVANIAVAISSQRIEKIIGNKKILLEKPEILSEGSGFIVSSDGLIVTAEPIVPETAQKIIVLLDAKQVEAQIKKRDKNLGLALLKIDENNLPVLPFAEQELKLGQQLFLIGAVEEKDKLVKFTESGIINQLAPILSVSFSRKDINGAPIFNIKGEVIGMNLIDENGQGRVVISSMIQELLK